MSNTFARPRPRTLGRGAAIVAGAIVALSQAVTPVLATELTPLPAAPALLGPADGASGQAGPLFRWTAVPHAWTYRLEVFRDSAMTGIPACSQETILRSARCPAELPPDTYYWRVRSLTVTSKGGPWSPTRLYVKTPRALPAPAITAPATGTALAYPAGLALLRWTPVANAYDYQVQLSTSSTFPAGPATGVAWETHCHCRARPRRRRRIRPLLAGASADRKRHPGQRLVRGTDVPGDLDRVAGAHLAR